jgi:hypothetical protein
MAWIGVSTRDEFRFALGGLGRDAGLSPLARGPGPGSAMLTQGTILVEAEMPLDDRAVTLLAWRRKMPWPSTFALRALPGRGIVMVLTQGDRVLHATLPHVTQTQGERIHVSYCWNAPARQGRLALKLAGTLRIYTVDVPAPPPIPLADLRAIVASPHEREIDDETQFIAVSDLVEPVGPQTSLSLHAPVLTVDGYRPAGKIAAGDVIRSIDGRLLPVLAAVRRTVPAYGSFAPVVLRAPYFGLREDVLVAPDQRLVIGGSEVEYLFGQEYVLVPARHLVNGTAAMHGTGSPTVTYVQLILPHHAALIVAGTPMESMFLGRIRRKPDVLAQTLLAGLDRDLLPEHAQTSYQVLRQVEAITLAQRRSA